MHVITVRWTNVYKQIALDKHNFINTSFHLQQKRYGKNSFLVINYK